MDSIFNFAIEQDEDEFTTSKKGCIEILKIIGVDTRFVSYTAEKFILITWDFPNSQEKDNPHLIKNIQVLK